MCLMCKQAEIDDYQNYESAVRALEEALRTLERSTVNSIEIQVLKTMTGHLLRKC